MTLGRTCIVFGAGASLDNAEHFDGGERNPPLDTTFFEKIRELEIEVPEELRAYAEDLPTGSPFDAKGGRTRMEEFFKGLFFDFSREGEDSRAIAAAYRELVELYRAVIARTTDWMNRDERSDGPIGRLVERVAEDADRITLVTFNQDLVLENEIYKRSTLRPLWCIEHGYGAFSESVEMTRIRGGGKKFDDHSEDCDGGRSLRILKLHGSLNWLVRMNGRAPSPRMLAGGSVHPRQVQVTRRRKVPKQLRYHKKKGRGRSVWYMWPILVPPVYNKQALIRPFLSQVWEEAQEALLECDRLVLYGYSLPATDVEAEMLFQRAILRNEELSAVEVINPDPDVSARYARLAPSRPLRWFPDVSTFLKSQS